MTLPKENKAVALMTVVILIVILTILSSVILSILANQNRYIEHNIARTKAKYAAEAVMVRELDILRRTGVITEAYHCVTGKYDSTTYKWNVGIGVTNTHTINIGIGVGVTAMNLIVDYSTSP